MASRRQRLVTAALLAGLVLGACGGGDDGDKTSAGVEDDPVVSMPSAVGEAGGTIEVSGKEFRFEPAQLSVKAGQPTKIVLKNIGAIEHDLTVAKADFKVTASPGKSRDKILTVDKPGTYKIYCSLAGHEDAGMKGELTVE